MGDRGDRFPLVRVYGGVLPQRRPAPAISSNWRRRRMPVIGCTPVRRIRTDMPIQAWEEEHERDAAGPL